MNVLEQLNTATYRDTGSCWVVTSLVSGLPSMGVTCCSSLHRQQPRTLTRTSRVTQRGAIRATYTPSYHAAELLVAGQSVRSDRCFTLNSGSPMISAHRAVTSINAGTKQNTMLLGRYVALQHCALDPHRKLENQSYACPARPAAASSAVPDCNVL